MCQRDSFKINTCANNAGIGNKLVTIFARHRDNFIMTVNFSLICQFFSGSGQILHPGQLYRSPGLAKIAPCWLARRDKFLAKVPGLVNGVAAPPTLTAHTSGPLAHIFGNVRLTPRAVFIKFYHDNRNSALYRDLPSHDGQKALAPSHESSVI